MTAPAPFVFLACLRRSGSTVLAEALTRLPDAFFFREPGLGRGRFRVLPEDVRAWRRLGVDLKAFRRRRAPEVDADPASLVRAFRDELLPELLGRVGQIGIKEIRLEGWEHVLEAFPEARVVVTGRDPRDLYLSIRERVLLRGKRWQGPFTAESVARTIDETFRRQLDICRRTDALRVRYEDLCSDPDVLERVKRFVASPLTSIGEIGGFNRTHAPRVVEVELHGERITTKRVARWRRETDEAALRDAERVYRLLPDYVRFWGYD